MEQVERLLGQVDLGQRADDTGEIAAAVLAHAPGGVDVALEAVGASTVRDTIEAVRASGTAVVIGLLGGHRGSGVCSCGSRVIAAREGARENRKPGPVARAEASGTISDKATPSRSSS